MQNLDNNSIEQLIIIFYIINYFNGDFSYKKILNTTNHANRFEILNLFESYLKNNVNVDTNSYYSEDKLTKGIQKSVVKRAENLNFEKQNNIYNQMMFDVKSKLSKLLDIDNFVIIDNSVEAQDLLVSYLFRTRGEVKFKTNDDSLFSSQPEVSDANFVNIINPEKPYKNSDNNIYYITKLTKENLNLTKNSNFIIDLKENVHNINGFRIVCLKDFDLKDSTFKIQNVCKLWSTLFYLGLNSLID